MNKFIATIHRDDLPKNVLMEKSILSLDIQMIESFLTNVKFLPRNKAEQNTDYKQIIPYIVIENEFKQIAAYKRKGNESRLHKLWSIGFVGHIEYADVENKFCTETIKKAALRELKEEFSDKVNYELIFKGIINEEITDVGKNHLGFVFKTLAKKNEYIDSKEIGNIEWVNIHNINLSEFELWSQMAFELIINH
jgi:predicted NUDIX family phosphoesterase